jgi:hypothetical protein
MICAKAERRLDSQGITQEYKSRDLKKSRWGKVTIKPILIYLSTPLLSPNPNTPILGSLS